MSLKKPKLATHKRTVLITGASAGFGRGLVSSFLADGWMVLAAFRQLQVRKLGFAEERAVYGDQLRLIELDVASEADRLSLCAQIKDDFSGRLDCLVNNAGYGVTGALEDLSEAQVRELMEVNFFGVAFLTRSLLPYLRAARGRVIQISSVAGFASLPLNSVYCASKHAVEGLSESLLHELAPHGVQVALVEPGGFATEFKASRVIGERARSPDSIYFDFTRRFEGVLKNPPAWAYGNPQVVIRKVVSLARQKKMPFRNPVGIDSRLTALAQKFFPRNGFTNILKYAYAWIIGRAK